MRLGDGRVSGIWLCGSDGYAPSRGFVVFTPYAITHMGFTHVEAQVLWITEGHEISGWF